MCSVGILFKRIAWRIYAEKVKNEYIIRDESVNAVPAILSLTAPVGTMLSYSHPRFLLSA